MTTRRIVGAGIASVVGWCALGLLSQHEFARVYHVWGSLAWGWFWLAWGMWAASGPNSGTNLARQSRWSSRSLLWIGVFAVLFRVCGLFSPPILEDDYFRFLWDGRMMALTGNPYTTSPAAHFGDSSIQPNFQAILDSVNHPDVPTVYGPVCQAAFAGAYWVSPGELWPWKLLLLFAEVGMAWGLWDWSRHTSSPQGQGCVMDPIRVIWFASWCPLAVFETSFNAHPEALAVSLMVVAVATFGRGALWIGGFVAGLAVATRIFALPWVPFLLGFSRRGWTGFGAALAISYLPFWLQGNLADLSGVLAMGREWEFNSSFFAVFQWAVGSGTARVMSLLIFTGIVVALLAREWKRRFQIKGDSDCNPLTSLAPGWVYSALWLLAATVNPWYLLWLLPFAALRPRIVWLTALMLVSISYGTGLNLAEPRLGVFEHPAWVRFFEYGGIAAAVGWEILQARRHGGRPRSPAPQPNGKI
ncbi:MAG: hypothetical protein EXS36_10675 [Pedosphaera sp.]|nr:hypothetical protein [Pedosphaera sp.]